MGISDHLTCLLRNLYAGQEETVRTGQGTMDWLQIGKESIKAVYCHPAHLTYMKCESESEVAQSCLTLCDPMDCSPPGSSIHGISQTEILYIIWNIGLDESQAGIKIEGRNINNLRYADDTTLMAESQAGLKLNIQKAKIMASSPITSLQIDGEKVEIVTDFIILGSKITAGDDCTM